MTNEKQQQLRTTLQSASALNDIGLEALIKAVGDLLKQIAPVQTRYKVSEVPDIRTIRYYISQNLMSKPVSYAGGRAHYEGSHILTLLFIKQQQAAHYSLRQIKQKLKGLKQQFRCGLQEYRQQLIDWLLEVRESSSNPVNKVALSLKYSIDTQCTVYVSEDALEQAQSTKKIVKGLRQLADELENK